MPNTALKQSKLQTPSFRKLRYPRQGRRFKDWIIKHYGSLKKFSAITKVNQSTISSYCAGHFKPTAVNIHRMIVNGHVNPDIIFKIYGSPNYTFGEFVRFTRYKHGFSTIKMGKQMHVSQREASRIEHDRYAPTTKMIRAIAHTFRIKPSTLWRRYLKFIGKPNNTLRAYIQEGLLDSHYTASDIDKICSSTIHRLHLIRIRKHALTLNNIFRLAVMLNLNAERLLKLDGYSRRYIHTYGGKMRFALIKHHMTCSELAHRLGCTRQAVSTYINNELLPNQDYQNQIEQILELR